MRRVFFLAQAEVLHVVRDRTTLAQVLIVPILQLLVLANAATFAIRNTPAYVVDLDRTSASRGLVNRLAASGHFALVGESGSPALGDQTLVDGVATAVLTIPHEFERSIAQNGEAHVELVVNAEKGSAAGIVQAYATQIVSAYAGELTRAFQPSARYEGDTPEQSPSPGTAQIDVRSRSLYNTTLNYQHYMVPGILVALVTLIGTLLGAQNIAREKELGTLEQLNVTPITRGQFIAAKLLPFWVLGLVELSLGLLVGRLVFDIPMRGSLLLLFGVAGIYLVSALGIGLFISTLVETQQQAMFVTFFVMNVYFLMSGLFTPIDSMAPWVQVVSEVNPVRHFVTISRAILMKGAGLADIAAPLGVLVLFAVVVPVFAVARSRKRTN